LSPRMRSTWK